MIDLYDEQRRLLAFARAAAVSPQGFAWLDEHGRVDDSQPTYTWITARMTHVFALAHLLGEPDCLPLVEHGVAALTGPLRDPASGGWWAVVDGAGRPVDDRLAAYDHAFVVLAASSAVAARAYGADALLDSALAVISERFVDPAGRVVDGYDAEWSAPDGYRGANSSMHMVEAFLAVGEVTGDASWHDRALVIASHLIDEVAREYGWRLPEHFTTDWTPEPDFNADQPDDPFRPFGCTPGHLLEWARLLIHLDAALPAPPSWLVEDARELFAVAGRIGWEVDEAPGFVYTTDWADRPVVRSRMHWVHAEAVLAAWALGVRTGEAAYDEWARTWWEYIEANLHDPAGGSWHHELDADSVSVSTTWSGKPDVYHAYQACLLPTLPLAPSAVRAVLLSRR